MMEYNAVLTKLGSQLIEQAYQAGRVIEVTQMAIGDGNGVEIEPSANATSIAGEFDRVDLTSGASGNSMIGGGVDYDRDVYAGRWIRTLGLLDKDGNLIVYANYPPTFIAPKGSVLFRTLGLNIQLPIVHGDAVVVIIDPSLDMASKTWVLGNMQAIPITQNVLSPRAGFYRFLSHATLTLDDQLPNCSVIRVSVDNEVNLDSGHCIVASGNPILSPRGADTHLNIIEKSKEFIFVKIDNSWRVS